MKSDLYPSGGTPLRIHFLLNRRSNHPITQVEVAEQSNVAISKKTAYAYRVSA